MARVTTASGDTFEIPVTGLPAFGARPKQAETNEGGDLSSQLTAALRPLPKELAQAFLDCFEGLLRNAVVVFAKRGDMTADGACHGGIALRVLGASELIAAALAAGKRDV